MPYGLMKHCHACLIATATFPPDLYKRLADIGISNVNQIAPATIDTVNFPRERLHIYVYIVGNLGIDQDFSCIQRLRRSQNPNVAFAPMMLIAERLAPTALKTAINAGFDDILLQPVGAAELHTRIVAAITSPRIFYATSDYAGPDRRRGLLARSGGAERRGPKAFFEEVDSGSSKENATKQESRAVSRSREIGSRSSASASRFVIERSIAGGCRVRRTERLDVRVAELAGGKAASG